MKLIIAIFSLFIIQDYPRVISLKEYYKYDSVIFGTETNYPFQIKSYKNTFNLSLDEVKKGEDFLFNNYFIYESIISEHFNNQLPDKKFIKSKNVKSKFYKFRRHYIGHVNSEGDFIINIILNDLSNETFLVDDTWKNNIHFSSNSRLYIINLTKNKFIFNVVGLDENGESK